MIAIATKRIHNPRAMYRVKCQVINNSTRTEPGRITPTMARSGSLAALLQDGRHTAPVIGAGLRRGAGPGSMTRRGVLHLTITDAGHIYTIAGAGCRVVCAAKQLCMRLRWLRLWAVVTAALISD